MDKKRIIIETLNAAETGSLQGNYSHIDRYADGKGKTRQITYGRSCTTEQGNLKTLLLKYVGNKGLYAKQLMPYMGKIGQIPLVDDMAFIALLKKAGEDPIMQKTQDDFFDEMYYNPSIKWCEKNGFILPLSQLVVYDSFIHSGSILDFLRERFLATPKDGEKLWIEQYTKTRHEWLANNSNKLLRNSSYRTKCYLQQIQVANWYLEQPFIMNGIKIK